jgi:hypothetical protein
MVLAVAHSLNEGLGRILGTRRRGHSQAHHLPAPQVQDDEGVEELESEGDDGEPVGGPRLVDVVADEG